MKHTTTPLRSIAHRALGATLSLAASAGLSGCSLLLDFDESLISDKSTAASAEAGSDGGDDGATSAADAEPADTGADTSGRSGCESASDCPGSDSDCLVRKCVEGACKSVPAADGTAVAAQTPGDCKAILCDGAGGTRTVSDNGDVPIDGKACTADVCTAGVGSNPAKPARTACSEGAKGKLCDGAGSCVECLSSADCASGVCNATNKACEPGSCTDLVKNGTETDVDCGGLCSTKCANAKRCGADGDCKSGHCNAGVCVECTTGAHCPSGVCSALTCSVASCADAVKNGSETDVDCGGTCAAKCVNGKRCVGDGDCKSAHCASGLCVECTANAHCPSGLCDAAKSTCATASCTDGVKNGSETDLDCGGTCGTKCALNKACGVNADCLSGHCAGARCVECSVGADCPSGVCNTTFGACSTAACSDSVKNGGETDIDCGGPCTIKCVIGQLCVVDADCTSSHCSGNRCVMCTLGSHCPSGVCDAAAAVCRAPTCADAVKNGVETDVDCGGTCTTKCALGKGCTGDVDCASAHCAGNLCVECTLGTHCASGVCDTTTKLCKAATCTDTVKNGTESDVDCGGACTTKCAVGKVCGGDLDCSSTHCSGNLCVECATGAHCTSGVCDANKCKTASCTDGVKNGAETDVDCGGGTCGPCAPTKSCSSAADCQSGVCTTGVCGAPAVVATTPANGATDVALASTVAVTFTAAMKASSLVAQLTTGACTGAIQVSSDDFATCIGFTAATPMLSVGDTVATLTPAAALTAGTTYKIRVTTSARDAFNNAIGATYTSATGFTTVPPP